MVLYFVQLRERERRKWIKERELGWRERERKQNKIETHWENQKMVSNTSQEALRNILLLWEFQTIAKDLGPFCCVFTTSGSLSPPLGT